VTAMQISSIGSVAQQHFAKQKIYSVDSVVKKLVESKDTQQKLTELQETQEKKVYTDLDKKSQTEVLQVLDTDCLDKTDSELYKIRDLAGYATDQTISKGDREKIQEQLSEYLNDINDTGKYENERLEAKEKADAGVADAAVNADAADDVSAGNETAPVVPKLSWAEELGIYDGLSVATSNDAKNSLTLTDAAIQKVEKEIDDLTYTVTKKDKISAADPSGSGSIDNEKSAKEFLKLVKTTMLTDSKQAVLSQVTGISPKDTLSVLSEKPAGSAQFEQDSPKQTDSTESKQTQRQTKDTTN
jgi:hypothetical protein